MKQKTKIAYLFAVVLVLAFSVATFAAMAKNDNAKNEKSNKSSQSEAKKKVVKLKVFEKADKIQGTTNAQIHRVKTQAVIQNLEQVATQEKSKGNTEVRNQVRQVVIEQQQAQTGTTEAIEEVENRGQMAKYIFGPDFKNLGQLRSSLVHNRNDIRKLTQTLNTLTAAGTVPAETTPTTGTDTAVTPPADNTATIDAITAQLVILEQERQRLRTIIYDNQEQFGLFGWMTKIMAGYVPLPVNDPEETALDTEVQNAINNTATVTTLPAIPTEPATGTTSPAL